MKKSIGLGETREISWWMQTIGEDYRGNVEWPGEKIWSKMKEKRKNEKEERKEQHCARPCALD